VVKRAVLVGFAGLAIHLVFPAITEVLASWPRLSTLDPRWFALAVAAEVAHFACPHPLPRLARTEVADPQQRIGVEIGAAARDARDRPGVLPVARMVAVLAIVRVPVQSSR